MDELNLRREKSKSSKQLRAESKALTRELGARRKELCRRVSEYRLRGELSEAIGYLERALNEHAYPDCTVLDHLAKAYADTGQFELAIAAVERTIRLGNTSPSTELQLAVLQARAGNKLKARDIFAKLTAANPDLHRAHLEYGCLLCEQGELERGMILIDRAIELAPDRTKYSRLAAKKLYRAGRQFGSAGERTKAINCLEKAADLEPNRIGHHILLANLRTQNGDKRRAISGLKTAADTITKVGLPPTEANDLVKMAAILHGHGELGAAWNLLERDTSGDPRVQKRRYIIKYFQGDMAAARREASAYIKLLESPMLRLPLTAFLEECLTQAQTDERDPEPAEWLWPKLNLPESSKQDWLLRFRWGLLTNRLVPSWILVNRERLHELDALVEPPDWSLLATAREEGRPIVLAGVHLGPQLVAVHYLDRLDHPMLIVGGNPCHAATIGCKPIVTAPMLPNMIELRDALERFGTVFLAGDGGRGRSRYPVKFLGSTVFLREGLAALARLGQARTFMCAAHWVGQRIKLELVEGPTALKDESREAWNERWYSFYMSQYERLLLAAPENVRTHSFWFLDQP